MKLKTLGHVLMFASPILGVGTLALAADGVQAPLTTPAGFIRTGQLESCIMANRIRQSRILNKNQILFEMHGGDTYLNEPPNACTNLRKSYALVYDVTVDKLCNTTIVHLSDPSSPVSERGPCGIGRFEKLEKAPKAQ